MSQSLTKVNGIIYTAPLINMVQRLSLWFLRDAIRLQLKRFSAKPPFSNRRPLRINIDKSGANIAALESLNTPGWLTGKKPFLIRQGKYLNNVVEQDHRHIKRITNPMGCFRKMHTASRALAGIELMNMIKKKQLKFTKYIDQNLSPAEQFYRLATVR